VEDEGGRVVFFTESPVPRTRQDGDLARVRMGVRSEFVACGISGGSYSARAWLDCDEIGLLHAGRGKDSLRAPLHLPRVRSRNLAIASLTRSG